MQMIYKSMLNVFSNAIFFDEARERERKKGPKRLEVRSTVMRLIRLDNGCS